MRLARSRALYIRTTVGFEKTGIHHSPYVLRSALQLTQCLEEIIKQNSSILTPASCWVRHPVTIFSAARNLVSRCFWDVSMITNNFTLVFILVLSFLETTSGFKSAMRIPVSAEAGTCSTCETWKRSKEHRDVLKPESVQIFFVHDSNRLWIRENFLFSPFEIICITSILGNRAEYCRMLSRRDSEPTGQNETKVWPTKNQKKILHSLKCCNYPAICKTLE